MRQVGSGAYKSQARPFAAPAFAAEFFVAQNNTTHKCSIVSKRPDGKRLTQLGTESFKTKSAAETALKGMSECRA